MPPTGDPARRVPEWVPVIIVSICLASIGYLVASGDQRRAYVDGRLEALEQRLRVLEVAHGPNPHQPPVAVQGLGGP